MKVITGLPADKNFKKNFVCYPGCLALSLDQHFPVCFSWATRTIVDLILDCKTVLLSPSVSEQSHATFLLPTHLMCH